MIVLQPYKLWVNCEHKTIKPDPTVLFPHHSCKLDPEDKMEGTCEECPYGKAPEPMLLKQAEIRREGNTIQYVDRLEEAFWKCPDCERDYVYTRANKEEWRIFTCSHCLKSFIDWSRAMLEK